MQINSTCLTLVDLSAGKMTYQPNKNKVSKTFPNMIQLPLENVQSNSIIYVDNKNCKIFSNPINIYNDGYIFSPLPNPYSLVANKDGTYDIEIIFPEMSNNLHVPSEQNPNRKKKDEFIHINNAEAPGPSNYLNAPGPRSPKRAKSDR